MKFALVNGEKLEATHGSKGVCPSCFADVRAYCGPLKVHHWKHLSLQECDFWYESETAWHRNWKNHFDSSCQEIIKIDPITGERHIADVYLPHKDLVIEFQHSPIQNTEIIAREQFYKRMLWIIDLSHVRGNINIHRNFRGAYLEIVYYDQSKNPNYFLMNWKFRHKRWEVAKSPLFFDVGDDYVYQKIEIIGKANCCLVKRYLKVTLISHYNINLENQN